MGSFAIFSLAVYAVFFLFTQCFTGALKVMLNVLGALTFTSICFLMFL